MEGPAYLLCTLARSGSSYLCQLLADTNVLGMQPPMDAGGGGPLPMSRAWDFRQAGMPARSARSVVASALSDSRTANGVAGIKLVWHQLAALRSAAELPAALGEEVYWLWLRRRDRAAQAVSWVKALQAGAWDAPGEQAFEGNYRYNYLWLATRERRIRAHEVAWARFFGAAGIEAMPLWYEDVVADPAVAVAAIADKLGVSLATPNPGRSGSVRRQGDAVNEEWLARYRRDSGGMGTRTLATLRSLAAPDTWGLARNWIGGEFRP